MNNKPLTCNLGAVCACLLCFLVTRGPRADNIQAINVIDHAGAKPLSGVIDSLSDITRGSRLEVMAEKDSVRLRMYTDNMFRVSRAELNREAQALLKAMSMRLRVCAPSHIHIEGYTSDEPTNTPQYPNNWYLSSARAIAVGIYLINETGFDSKRITAQGRGSSEPLGASDKTKNNRIEIIITP